jgi:hypothetical protein
MDIQIGRPEYAKQQLLIPEDQNHLGQQQLREHEVVGALELLGEGVGDNVREDDVE